VGSYGYVDTCSDHSFHFHDHEHGQMFGFAVCLAVWDTESIV